MLRVVSHQFYFKLLPDGKVTGVASGPREFISSAVALVPKCSGGFYHVFAIPTDHEESTVWGMFHSLWENLTGLDLSRD